MYMDHMKKVITVPADAIVHGIIENKQQKCQKKLLSVLCLLMILYS